MFVLLEASICVFALTEETSADFNDLGKLMIAGLAAAIVFALAFTFVRLRLREKTPQSNFISISSTQKKNEEAGN